jgi:Zn-dependent protease with chaperone function
MRVFVLLESGSSKTNTLNFAFVSGQLSASRKLLIFAGISSLSDKEYVAVVIAHELAHQWFGDLGTNNYLSHIKILN